MNYIDFSLFFFTFGIDEVAIVNAFSCPTYFHEICGVDAPVKVNPAVGGGGYMTGVRLTIHGTLTPAILSSTILTSQMVQI